MNWLEFLYWGQPFVMELRGKGHRKGTKVQTVPNRLVVSVRVACATWGQQ